MRTSSPKRSRIGRYFALILASVFALALTASPASADDVVANPGPVELGLVGGTLAIGDGSILPIIDINDLGDEGEIPSLSGTVDANGNITVPAANISFPDLPLQDSIPVDIIGTMNLDLLISIVANSNATGTINPDTGEVNLNVSLRIEVRGTINTSVGNVTLNNDGRCRITPLNLNLSTNKPNGVPYSAVSGQSRVQDDNFGVPAITTSGSPCGTLLLVVNIASQLNSQLGLPITAGQSNAELQALVTPTLYGSVKPAFTVDPSLGLTPLPVTFDATSSQIFSGELELCEDVEVDEDCGYQWDWNGDGDIDHVTNSPVTNHTYTTAGHKSPKLVLCNDAGICAGASGQVAVDSTIIEFTSQPAALSNNTSATFAWTASPPVDSYECSLDGADWAACSTPVTFEGLADGSHSLKVRGVIEGVPSLGVTSNTFVVDTAAPVITFGGSSPSNTNSLTEGEVSWTATSNNSVSFQCRYDSNDPEEFVTCGSPVPVTWPAEVATHTFDVRATDSLGNVSTATRTWGFDNRPIVASWTSAPVGAWINAAGAVFTWEFNREGVTSQCRKNATAFANCNSGSLGAGSFTNNNASQSFSARGIDAFGNVSNELTQTFGYDTSAPGAGSITGGPAASSLQTNGNVEFTFTVPTAPANNAPISAQCSMNSTTEYEACTSPKSYSLENGSHTFRVRTIDAAGNVQTATVPSRAFSVQTAPTLTFGGGLPSNTNSATSGSVSWTSNMAATFECSYDGADFAPCESPVPVTWPAEVGQHTFSVRGTNGNEETGPTITHTWGYDDRPITASWTSAPVGAWINASGAVFTWEFNREGVTSQCRKNATAFANCNSGSTGAGSFTNNNAAQSFSARGIDSYGNVSNELTQTFGYDTTAPGAGSITGGPAANSTVTSSQVTFTWTTPTAPANNAPISTQCSFNSTAAASYSACSSPATFTLSNGSQTFRVRTIDAAGNVQTATVPSRAFTVNTSSPFELELNHGVASFGVYSDLDVVDSEDPATLSGSFDIETGEVTVPAAGVSIPGTEFNIGGGTGLQGSVTFSPNGTHLAGTWNPVNGKLTIRGPFRASVVLTGDEATLNCHTTANLQFSSDRTVPYRGTRFSSGLSGAGAISAAWDTLGSMRGDAGCSDLNPFMQGPGAIWLSRNIESPFPPAPVGPIELTPPTLIDSSGELATEITPGRRLICVAGTWSNVTRGTFAWTKDDAPFSNLKADGAGSDVYRPTAADIGSTFSCHQVMRNAEVTGVVGSSSNSAVVVPHG